MIRVPAKEFLMEETKKQNTRWNANKTFTLVGMAMLTAVVAVLQALCIGIQLNPFTVITLTLAPIIVGTALYGWKAGAWLGAVFGFVVLVSGQATGFMQFNVVGTIVTVMLKGILAGTAAGLVYTAIARKNTPKTDFIAVIAAGIVAPVVNTGVYILGCVVFFFNQSIAPGMAEKGMNAWQYIFGVMVGVNFPIELGINLVLASAIVYIVKLGKKMIKTH